MNMVLAKSFEAQFEHKVHIEMSYVFETETMNQNIFVRAYFTSFTKL